MENNLNVAYNVALHVSINVMEQYLCGYITTQIEQKIENKLIFSAATFVEVSIKLLLYSTTYEKTLNMTSQIK